MKVQQIYDYINTIAPFDLALDYDNVGLLVGNPDQTIKKVLLALDITSEVVAEAINVKADLIVSHHPIIFNPLKSVVANRTAGNIPYQLIQNGISVICAHTNLDIAEGGVNDALAHCLGIINPQKIDCPSMDERNLIRIGNLKNPIDLTSFAQLVKKQLNCSAIRTNRTERQVHKVAVCGGAGGDLLTAVYQAGADTFVTADIKHHIFIEAQQMQINLIDAGHFATENIIIPVLAQKLTDAFGEIQFIISKQQNPVTFM